MNGTKPKISVIIPAYNHESYVDKAVDSILNQTFQDFELIIINDGSSDKTGDVIQRYKDSRIAYIYQENKDAPNTINRGLHLAKGSFISILNSDDVYALDRLERLLDEHERSKAECIFTNVQPITDKGEKISDPYHGWNAWHNGNREFYFRCRDLYTAFLRDNLLVTTSNYFMTAEAVKVVGDFCGMRYMHDLDYIFRVLSAFPDKVSYLHDETLLYYRIHSSNTISKGPVDARLEGKALVLKYMLDKISPEHRMIVTTGINRLATLERELDERADLHGFYKHIPFPFMRLLKKFIK